MIKIFPKFEDKLLQLRHNTLISSSLFQILIFFGLSILMLKGILNFESYALSILPNIVLPVLVIFLARKNYYLISSIYISVLYLSNLTVLFLINGSSNQNNGFFITSLFLFSILFILTINWKIGVLTVLLNLTFLILDLHFEKTNLLNTIPDNPIPDLYFILLLSSYQINIIIMVVSYTTTLVTIFNNYKQEIEKRISYEEEFVRKNYSLNELNSNLEENMSLLEETNDKLNSALVKAHESDKLKTAFLQNISHEVRTPLNAIIGFLNIIKDNNLINTCNQDQYINPTINAGYQLLNVISDIIELSQIDADTLTINSYRFNVNNLINELSNKTLDDCKDKNLIYILKNSIPDSKAIMKSDQLRISQILNNLLSNAVKFTFDGKIEFHAELKNDEIIFRVKDTGIGIKQDQLDEIFKRFNKLDTDISKLYGGLGIGLTIAEELTNRLNGKIEVTSEYGKGTEFTVTLPYIEAGLKTDTIPSSKDITEVKIKKVLIAEDDVSNYKYLEVLLSKYTDITLLHAWNGAEAVDIFKTEPDIDLVLMDIKMPVMDGIKAFKEIKKINPGILIFAVTAYALDHEKEKFMSYGFDGYITKPVRKGEILGLLQISVRG